MNAGQTELKVGTRVRLKNIEGEVDFLNGLTGSLTHPFAFGEQGEDWVGVWLDSDCSLTPYGGRANVKETELEILD